MRMTSRQFRVLMALTVVSGFLGGAASNLLLQGAPARAQAGGAVQGMVRAKQFKVVDDQGRTRATLGLTTDSGCGLFLYDAAGKIRATLCLGADGGPGLWLYDAAGEGRTMLAVSPDGRRSGLTLWDAAGVLMTTTTHLDAWLSSARRAAQYDPQRPPPSKAEVAVQMQKVSALYNDGVLPLDMAQGYYLALDDLWSKSYPATVPVAPPQPGFWQSVWKWAKGASGQE